MACEVLIVEKPYNKYLRSATIWRPAVGRVFVYIPHDHAHLLRSLCRV